MDRGHNSLFTIKLNPKSCFVLHFSFGIRLRPFDFLSYSSLTTSFIKTSPLSLHT
ncbi:hypothetical protein HanRHA438_Chr12g0532701 [Helianthus annuus]|nr:hypothetical protein HanRHA438_Chr12g0532701 [Helianthus annuus]